MLKFNPDIILADFDGTITKKVIGNKRVPSLISILRDENILDEDYSKKAKQLYEKYVPLEKNPNISEEEKFQAMKSWWEEHYKLLKDKKLKKQDIEKAVAHKNIQLREGFEKILNLNIPIIVLSSNGLGEDSIKMVFEKFNIPLDNIYIISNKLEFNKNGEFIGIKKGSLIHGMNKRLKYHLDKVGNIISGKENILLLGDNLHDIDMIEGLDFNKVYSVCFWQEDDEKMLDIYKEKYDLVLPATASFEEIGVLLLK